MSPTAQDTNSTRQQSTHKTQDTNTLHHQHTTPPTHHTTNTDKTRVIALDVQSPLHCTGYSQSRNNSTRDPPHTWDQSCPRRQGSTDRLQSYTGSRCSQDNTRHLTHDTNDHTRRQPTQDDNRPKTTTTSGHRHKTTRQQDNKTTRQQDNKITRQQGNEQPQQLSLL